MSGSVLETFWLLFDSDASKVKKGAQEAEVAATGLESKLLSVDGISTELGNSFLGMAKQAAGAFAAIFAVQKIIGTAMENAEFARHVGETAEALGISTRELGAWGDAVKHIGGSAEGAIDSFKALSGSLAQVDATGHSRVKPFFDELGIDMMDAKGHIKPVNDLLLEMADHFKTMSKQESFGFGRKMQLDEGMIRLLQQGRDGVQGLIGQMHSLGDITDRDADAAKEWYAYLDNAEHSVRTFSLGITTKLLPNLISLGNWFSENKDPILDTLGAITGAIVILTTRIAIMKTVALGGSIITGLQDILAFVQLIGVAWETAAGAELIAMAPIELIAAAIAAMGYALYKLYENWDDIFSWIGKKIDWIIEKFGELGNWISRLFGGKNEFNLSADKEMEHIITAQGRMAGMSAVGLNSQNSASIMNSAKNYNTSNSVSIDKIEIHTPATDGKELFEQMKAVVKDVNNNNNSQVINSHANGLRI